MTMDVDHMTSAAILLLKFTGLQALTGASGMGWMIIQPPNHGWMIIVTSSCRTSTQNICVYGYMAVLGLYSSVVRSEADSQIDRPVGR